MKLYGCWGFELGPNGTPACPDFTPTGSAEVQSTTKRSGSYALRCYPASGASGYGVWCDLVTGVSLGQRDWCGVRFYMMPTDRPTSVARMIYKFSGGTGAVELRHRTDGKLDLLYGSVLKGTTAVALTDSTKLYRIGILEDRYNDKVKLYVDGVMELEIALTIGTVNWTNLTLGFYGTEAEAVEAIFDDVCLVAGDNADGPSVPEQGRVLRMTPDAEGAYVALDRNAEDADWKCVDEAAHDADTTYLYTTSDIEKKESHHLTQPVPADNVGINAVMPFVVEREPTAVNCVFALGLRVGSTDHLPSLSAARNHSGFEALTQLQEYCPTYAELATLQILYTVDNSGVGSVRVTQAAVQVDYAEPAPQPPINLKPVDGAVSLVQGPTFAGDYVQGGGGPMAYAQVEVWNVGLTTKVWDSGDVANTGTRFLVGCSLNLTPGTSYKWHARCKDDGGCYSDWSSWMALTIDASPTTPTGCDPTGGESVTDPTPDLTWTHNDPDGHVQRFYQVELRRNDTGDLVSGYPKTPAGAIDTFSKGTAFLDSDESQPTYKAWSQRGTWARGAGMACCGALGTGKGIATVDSGLSGSAATVRVRAKVKCAVGNGIAFRVVNIAAGSEDMWVLKFIAGSVYGGRLRLVRFDGSSTEVVVQTSGDLDLVEGQYYWLAVVIMSGDHIGCLLDDVTVLATISAENQSASIHGLYTEATGVLQFDDFLVQGVAGETASDTAPTLTVGVTYKWKVRTHDGQGWGVWSGWAFFTITEGVTASITSPTENEEKTGLPITVGWSMGGGIAPQTQYRVLLYAADGTTLLEDSGWKSGAGSSYELTYAGWQNVTTYKAKVGVRDSSGPPVLEGWSGMRTFSTNWSPPPAPTNVAVAAVVTGNPHLHLSWDISDQSDFLRYEVWRRRNGETAYMRIAVIAEKTTTVYDDYKVDLKYTWEYVVKQVITIGSDQVPSAPSAMVYESLDLLDAAYLHDTTDEVGVYVLLQLEPSRDFLHEIDRSTALPWGARKPVEFIGEAEWWTFQIGATWLMDDDASREVLSSMLTSGNTLCYRDGRGRRFFCRPEQTSEADVLPARFGESIPMTEVDFCESV